MGRIVRRTVDWADPTAGYPVLLHWLDVSVDAVVQRARTRRPYTVGAVASGGKAPPVSQPQQQHRHSV
jgi:hypothetical protein